MPELNIATYDRAAHDDLMYNVVTVTWEDADGLILYQVTVRNDDPNSATSTLKLGERDFFFTSQFFDSNAAADDAAEKFLSIHAQEQFDFNLGSVVYPWIEVGNAILVDTAAGDASTPDSAFPTRFLLTSVTIPMSLGDMTLSAGRVSLVES
jgi:hypothetical protein